MAQAHDDHRPRPSLARPSARGGGSSSPSAPGALELGGQAYAPPGAVARRGSTSRGPAPATRSGSVSRSASRGPACAASRPRGVELEVDAREVDQPAAERRGAAQPLRRRRRARRRPLGPRRRWPWRSRPAPLPARLRRPLPGLRRIPQRRRSRAASPRRGRRSPLGEARDLSSSRPSRPELCRRRSRWAARRAPSPGSARRDQVSRIPGSRQAQGRRLGAGRVRAHFSTMKFVAVELYDQPLLLP